MEDTLHGEKEDSSFTSGLTNESKEVSNLSPESFSVAEVVKKGLYGTIRIRFDTILADHKLQWADVYNAIGLSKAYASLIRNGHTIPPKAIRISLAREMNCDTSSLWEAPELIEASKMMEDKQ